MRKKTTAEFVAEAKAIHGDKYDYSKFQYKGVFIEGDIICPTHGIFKQKPTIHLKGSGCTICFNDRRKLGSVEFIKRAIKVHGDLYNYSQVEYTNQKTNITIICKEHGTFSQNPDAHLRGFGCSMCSGKKANDSLTFSQKANLIHDNLYDYSLVNYKNNSTKVKIICPSHGAFKQIPNAHLNGQGCPKCGREKANASLTLNTDDFKIKAKKVHGDKYVYDRVRYKGNALPVIIVCNKHGEFNQTPNSHLCGNGCPSCSRSIGEDQIAQWLNKHSIEFVSQKRFDKCKSRYKLPFDFYIPGFNLLIEYDGIQHFKSIEFWGGEKSFIKLQKHDKIKTEFAKANGYNLLRIKYTEFDRIEEILSKALYIK